MNPSQHLRTPELRRYATGDVAVAGDMLWAVEAHLEICSPCRERLNEQVARQSPQTAALLVRVQAALSVELTGDGQMPARRLPRRLGWWVPPGLLPRLAMTLLVVAAALGLDLAGSTRVLPSLVLLVAPVAPLLGVSAVWSTSPDPAHELVVASPRAGLSLVLQRTLAVLVVVIPALTVAGWLAGTSPAAWLLPCLAFTAGALALGEVVALRWAAIALGLVWTVGVITPTVLRRVLAPGALTTGTPWLLRPGSLPYWTGLVIVIAIVLVARRDAYAGLRSDRWFVR